MALFALVHGAWHGAWCWEKVIPGLEAHGHRAVAMDMPHAQVTRRNFWQSPARGHLIGEFGWATDCK